MALAPLDLTAELSLLLAHDLEFAPAAKQGGLLLADAFSEFISASARLESSYRDLQQEVAGLNAQLAARNAALHASLAENARMQAALEQIVDAMPCGVLVIDAGGLIQMINAEGRRLLSLDGRGTLRGLAPRSLIPLAPLLHYALAPGADDAEQELAYGEKDQQRWLSIRRRNLSASLNHGQPRKQAQGRSESQTILILRDITAHKQVELERESARRTMTLAEVAAILAHEIRNPLASLELFAGLITSDAAGRPTWISHLRAGIRSLAGTVNNVLSFHSPVLPNREPVDLAALVHDAVEFARPIAEQANILLVLSGAGPDPALPDCTTLEGAMPGCAVLTVDANPAALQQVALNLITNAIRHTAPGGRIDVSVASSAAGAVIVFTDTGSGIAPAQLALIFNPGFSGGGHSCGLGLAVCRQIVSQHGGAIRVTSNLGVGTTFTVELPAL